MPDCKKSIGEFVISESLAQYFEEGLQISQDLSDWCIQHFEEIMIKEKGDESQIRASREKEVEKLRQERDEIIMMRARKLIEEDDFLRMKPIIESKIQKAEKSFPAFQYLWMGSGVGPEKGERDNISSSMVPYGVAIAIGSIIMIMLKPLTL